MIANCPHCQNGFYIASELAGQVVTCSKCKKQVRAPDRRGGGLDSPGQANDGVPTAKLAETRVEVEERLKGEAEARFEAEKGRKEALEAKTRAEEQAKVDSQARAEAEEQLKTEVQLRSAVEAQLSAATKTESQDHAELEEKLREAVRARDELELKLKDAEATRARAEALAESESQAKANIEQLMQAEVEARVKAESQAKAEAIARKKAQTQLNDEVEAREKAEQETAAAKTRLRDAEVAAITMSPINLDRGLMRLAFVLSFIFAGVAGLIAYRNGYIIWSQFDRPVRLPLFSEPVYLPIVLIAFCVGGFAAAWVAYLVAIFVIKGFRQPSVIKEKKHRRPEPKDEEVVSSGGKMWRSS